MFCLTNVYSKCNDMKCSPCHAQVAIFLLPRSLETTAKERVIDFRPAQNAAIDSMKLVGVGKELEE